MGSEDMRAGGNGKSRRHARKDPSATVMQATLARWRFRGYGRFDTTDTRFMSARKNPPKSAASNTRMMIAGALVLLVVAALLVLRQPAGDGRDETADDAHDDAVAATTAVEAGVTGDSAAPVRTRSGRERLSKASADVDAAIYPHVSRVLSDESIGVDQAAVELLDIVQRADVSEDERLEALSHGLNLDFAAFAAVAADPVLPVPLAERYFAELCNQNDLPEAQIHGCLDLMSHQDEGIRAEAAEQLAFMVEKEELAESPDALRQAAAEHLAKLQNQPPDGQPTGDEAALEPLDAGAMAEADEEAVEIEITDEAGEEIPETAEQQGE